MDPPATGYVGGSLISPAGSRISLPSASESIFASLSTPTPSGPSTGSTIGDGRPGDQKREVFSDFRRFVSFGLRKDSVAPS